MTTDHTRTRKRTDRHRKRAWNQNAFSG